MATVNHYPSEVNQGIGPAAFDFSPFARLIRNSQQLIAGINAGDKYLWLAKDTIFDLTENLDVSNLLNIRIVGQGPSTVLNFEVADAGFIGSNSEKITFENFSLTGSMSRGFAFENSSFIKIKSVNISGVNLAQNTSGYPAGIYLYQCDDCLIDDVFCYNNGNGASNTVSSLDLLFDGGGSRNRVTNSKFLSTSVTMNVMMQTHALGDVCDRNTFDNIWISGAVCKPDLTAWGYGLAFYGIPGGGEITRTILNDIHVYDTEGNGLYIKSCIGVTGNNLEFTNIEGVGTVPGSLIINVESTHVNLDNIVIDGSHSFVIRGDYSNINNLTMINGSGINLFVAAEKCNFNNVIIIGTNTIQSIGLQSDQMQRCTFTNLNISGCGTYGVLLEDSSKCTISHSNIYSNSIFNPNSYDGIYLQGGEGITIDTCNVNSNDGNQRYGITNAGCENIVIINNDLSGNTTGAYFTSGGTNPFLRNNKYTDTGSLTGIAVLVGGTVTVNNDEIITGDRILVHRVSGGGVRGELIADSADIVNTLSFIIKATDSAGVLVADTSTVHYEIIH
jgi:hypothetical protein